MTSEQVNAYLTCLGHMLLADGKLTIGETVFLGEVSQRFGLPASTARKICLMIGDVSQIGDCIASIPAEHHEALLKDLEMAAAADGKICDAERKLMANIQQLMWP